jgi:hypothetical protein
MARSKFYTSEYTTASGEKMYLCMERVTPRNIEQVQLYYDVIKDLSDSLKEAFNQGEQEEVYTALGINDKSQKEKFSKPATNGGDGQYKNFGAQLMVGTKGGIAGFIPDQNGDFYITYASSTPIPKGGLFRSLPKNKNYGTKDRPALLNFVQQNYGNLIMSVGTNMGIDAETYENRGIMRNPISALNGDYKEIGMVLHGFSGKIAKNKFNKIQMLVRPLSEMFKRIESSLPGDAFVEKYSYKDIPRDFRSRYPKSRGYGILDGAMVIKAESLKLKYDELKAASAQSIAPVQNPQVAATKSVAPSQHTNHSEAVVDPTPKKVISQSNDSNVPDSTALLFVPGLGFVSEQTQIACKGAKLLEITCLAVNCCQKNENVHFLSYYLTAGVDVNFNTTLKNVLLHEACANGSTEAVKILLEKGAVIDPKNFFDETPLLAACTKGHVEIAKLLLEKGADINAANDEKITPAKKMAESRNPEMKKLLQQHNKPNQAPVPQQRPATQGSALSSNPDLGGQTFSGRLNNPFAGNGHTRY